MDNKEIFLYGKELIIFVVFFLVVVFGIFLKKYFDYKKNM